MRKPKVHLKLKGRALCGQKKKVEPLKFSTEPGDATCKRCEKAAAT
jgi:hypothetical protein